MIIYKKIKKEEKLKIFFDIDNVLAITVWTWLPYFNEENGVNFFYEQFKKPDLIPPEGTDIPAWKPLWHLERWLQKEAKSLKHQGKDLIKELKKCHDLAAITDRKTHIMKPTEKWLHDGYENAFSHRCFFSSFVGKNKTEICRELEPDLMIEDYPENVIPIAQLGIPVLMMDCPWNQDVETGNGITRIHSLAEVQNYI